MAKRKKPTRPRKPTCDVDTAESVVVDLDELRDCRHPLIDAIEAHADAMPVWDFGALEKLAHFLGGVHVGEDYLLPLLEPVDESMGIEAFDRAVFKVGVTTFIRAADESELDRLREANGEEPVGTHVIVHEMLPGLRAWQIIDWSVN